MGGAAKGMDSSCSAGSPPDSPPSVQNTTTATGGTPGDFTAVTNVNAPETPACFIPTAKAGDASSIEEAISETQAQLAKPGLDIDCANKLQNNLSNLQGQLNAASTPQYTPDTSPPVVSPPPA